RTAQRRRVAEHFHFTKTNAQSTQREMRRAGGFRFLPFPQLSWFALMKRRLGTSETLPGAGFLPNSESSNKCIGVVADTAACRQLFQFFHVASAEHHFVRFDRSDQALDHVSDVASPFFLPMLLEAANPDVVLEGGLLVRQVAQLHRLDNAIHDQGGPKTGPEP